MDEQPNILMIYADQMRYDCAGFSGNPDVKTPHLDRLAMEGVRFDEAFVSYPLCRPFRASLLTGKYAHRTGAYTNHSPFNPNQPSLATVLNAVGYKSGYVGKWHLRNEFLRPGFVPPGPDRMGFDDFVGFNDDHRYMDAIFYRDTDQPYHCRRFEPDFQTDHAIEFMERARASGCPFLAYVSFGPPHPPMNMPEYWRRMYDPGRIKLPKGSAKFKPMKLEDVTGKSQERRAPDSESESEIECKIREYVSGYYGLISGVDFNVGRLLNWLDANALAERTIVVFFSDHGDMLGQNDSYCATKSLPYRAAAQVPLLVRFPGRFASGKRVNSLVDVAVDTMPTLMQACGVDTPEVTQGISYLPLLVGSDTPTRDHVQYQKMGFRRNCVSGKGLELTSISLRGIRTRNWLFVRDMHEPLYLFDQKADRDELANLADDPAHAEILAELDARVRRNMRETGDAWELAPGRRRPGFKARDEIHAHRFNVVIPAAIEVP